MNVVKNIDFPAEILLTLRKSEKEFLTELKRIAAVNYYKERKLSLGQCSELSEMSEEEFIKYLGSQGISIFSYESKDELLEDMRNA